MAQFSKDDDDKFQPPPPNPHRRPDTRPWRERVKARRNAYERHWLSCEWCQELTTMRREVMTRNSEPGAETARANCPQGELLQTLWLTEPK